MRRMRKEIVSVDRCIISKWSEKALALAGLSVRCIRSSDCIWNGKCNTGEYNYNSNRFCTFNYGIIEKDSVGTLNLIIGIVLAILIGMILLGGIKRIGQVTEKLVPFMAAIYVILALGVVVLNFQNIPSVFGSIFEGAFSPASVTGGAVGSFFMSMKKGVSRGIFSNEAGLGTGSIAHACADTKTCETGIFRNLRSIC